MTATTNATKTTTNPTRQLGPCHRRRNRDLTGSCLTIGKTLPSTDHKISSIDQKSKTRWSFHCCHSIDLLEIRQLFKKVRASTVDTDIRVLLLVPQSTLDISKYLEFPLEI